MKKSELYDQAEMLYVDKFQTYEQIARALGCSGRTLQTWSKEGRWKAKRTNLKAQQEDLSDDVRDIAKLLADVIKDQLNNGESPQPHTLNAFTRMAGALLKMQDYEKNIEQDAAELNGTDGGDKKIAAGAGFKLLFGTDTPEK